MRDTILLFGYGLMFTLACPILEWIGRRCERARCHRCRRPQHALYPVAGAMLLCHECHDSLADACIRDVILEGTED